MIFVHFFTTITQLEEANKRLSKARDLLPAGDIEANDYRIIKSETEKKINRFEAKLAVSVKDTTDIRLLLNTAISNISSDRCFMCERFCNT